MTGMDTGTRVTWPDPAGPRAGTVIGVAEDGGLVVRPDGGNAIMLGVGEVKPLPPAP